MPFLPMSKAEMTARGWEQCDFIVVTGDAYIDHPGFGAAIIGRTLESAGYRVGIIAQPDWTTDTDWLALGAPRLGFGITAGNMDSMVNHYTAQKKLRHNDAYSPNGNAGYRPDRATLIYCNKVRQLYKNIPVIIGGIEASMRRIAHYDFWQDKVRNSILADAKADILVYGMGEKVILEIVSRLDNGITVNEIKDIPGTVVFDKPTFSQPRATDPHVEQDADPAQTVAVPFTGAKNDATPVSGIANPDTQQIENLCYKVEQDADPAQTQTRNYSPPQPTMTNPFEQDQHPALQTSPDTHSILLPEAETCKDKPTFLLMTQLFHNNYRDKTIWQKTAGRYIRHNPPAEPLTTEELDKVYALPYMRLPHPRYEGRQIPAWVQIKDSITSHRGCMGGCHFCTIGYHQGKAIQSRSETSILKEVRTLAKSQNFHGTISDIGGPSANMYGMSCGLGYPASCKRNSCLYPSICKQLDTSHQKVIHLLNQALKAEGINHVFVASGIRFDLALMDTDYIKQISALHTGGLLKLAPEHSETSVLDAMGKPGIKLYLDFCELFFQASQKAGKRNNVVPYIIVGHPGSTMQDAVKLHQWLKSRNIQLEQIQEFTPTPMTISTCMYYTGLDFATGHPIYVPKGRDIRLQKALALWYLPDNQPLIREALGKL